MRTCPYCGSQRLVRDSLTGQLTCLSCGSVIEDYDFEEPTVAYNEGNAIIQEPKKPGKIIINTILKNEYMIPLLGKSIVYYNGKRRIVRYSRARAIKIIEENSELSRCIVEALEEKFLETTIAAIIIYIKEKREGVGRRRALKIAASRTGASEDNLARVIRRYRDQIEECANRVLDRGRQREIRSGVGSEEDSRAHLRGDNG